MPLNIYNEIITQPIANLLAAIITLFIGLVIGRFVGRLIQKILNNLSVNEILKKEANLKIPLEEAMGALSKYTIYLIVVIMALNQLNLATIILNIILIIILVVVILLGILAVKDFLPNIVAGFLIHQKGFIKEGDYIKVKSVEGKIEHISPTETKIKTKQGDTIFVPNLTLIKNEVTKLKK